VTVRERGGVRFVCVKTTHRLGVALPATAPEEQCSSDPLPGSETVGGKPGG